MKRMGIILALALAAVLMAAAVVYREYCHRRERDRWQHTAVLIVSKQDMTLRLIDYKGNVLLSAPVATGLNAGNKQKQGDMRTPEGVFQVVDIQRSSAWKHDFGDGKGAISGSYGDYFIRLDVPGHAGIGIHGTHLPESIGTRASEGCIRLHNDDLNRLVSLIYPPLTVIITPAASDEAANTK